MSAIRNQYCNFRFFQKHEKCSYFHNMVGCGWLMNLSLPKSNHLGFMLRNWILAISRRSNITFSNMFITEYNALQLDQLTGKMRRTRRPIPLNRKVQSLAFIHEIPLHKPLCGGALVTEQNCFAAILADGFCISDQTVLSSLRVELNIYDRPANPSFFLVIRKLNLARDNFNLVLLLVSTSTEIKCNVLAKSESVKFTAKHCIHGETFYINFYHSIFQCREKRITLRIFVSKNIKLYNNDIKLQHSS